MDKYISLIGLGVVGTPLSQLLLKKYKDDFVLLSSEEFAGQLKENKIFINGEEFSPKIFTKKEQLNKKIGIVFVCVKNYHLENTIKFLKTIIDEETIILPLQNGVYSFDLFTKEFPSNIVLEGFAKGPNTQKLSTSCFVYQKPGSFYIGSSEEKNRERAKTVCKILTNANVDTYYEDNIQKQVWQKLMLNVAGNAITALTNIDYCMFKHSKEAQEMCLNVMKEFLVISNKKGITLTENDINEIMNYFLSFDVSKRTSMLDDVTYCRQTENDYLAGYIFNIANCLGIRVPYIESVYKLMKIKEDVYLKKI